MHKPEIAGERMHEACRPYHGCQGSGWLYDLEDSGSGRTVYCSCAAGDVLRARELSARIEIHEA